MGYSRSHVDLKRNRRKEMENIGLIKDSTREELRRIDTEHLKSFMAQYDRFNDLLKEAGLPEETFGDSFDNGILDFMRCKTLLTLDYAEMNNLVKKWRAEGY